MPNLFTAVTNNPFVQRMAGSLFSGVDAASGNTITDPNPGNVLSAARDLIIEALPGDQKTNLDNPFSGQESIVKKGSHLRKGDLASTAVHTNTARQVGRAREKSMEGLRNRVISNIARRAPGIIARTGTGTAASGGIAAPALTAWGAYDLGDAISEGVTGQPLSHHVNQGWQNSVVQPDGSLRLPPTPF